MVVSFPIGVLGTQLLTVEPYLQPFHVAFLRQSLSLTLKFILLARPAGQQALGICLFTHAHWYLQLLCGFEYLNSGSASTVLTEPSS